MFSVREREELRAEIVQAAQADPRISGAALTGSASVGREDRWSDIDLAFGVRNAAEVAPVLADFSERMYSRYHALHHLDVLSGAWIYRVFLLPNSLQVDLAFAPAGDFGARGPTFQLLFGNAVEQAPAAPTGGEESIGWAWLYALHARSALARAKHWQAEYMISGMRDQVFALACLRYGLPTRDGRGMDALPPEVTTALQDTLVRTLDAPELRRAFRAVTRELVREIRDTAPDLTRLERTLHELTEIPTEPATRSEP